MRHKVKRHQLNRFTSWRKATIKSMARNMIAYQSMTTTLARAKAVQPVVEKLITLARANDLAARRHAFDILQDHDLVKTLFTDIGPRFSSRNGGYTRIIKLRIRRGDNASMVIFELMEIKKKEVKQPKKAKAKDSSEAPVQVQDTVSEKSAAVKKRKQEDKPTATGTSEKEHSQSSHKPGKKFLGGIRSIFKKKSDSL